MNVLFTICGRAGSKGVKNKNVKDFLGVPLVFYSLSAFSLYAKQISHEHTVHIALNTDSRQLVDIVGSWKQPDCLIIRREEALGGDQVAKVAVIKDTLLKVEAQTADRYDVVVDLDITSPLRTVDNIREAIDKKIASPHTDVVFSVTNARRNPYFNMVKENGDGSFSKVLESNFVARQQAPLLYDMNASIYAYAAEFLRTNASNAIFDGRCDIVKMMDTGILDIDSEEDYELMQVIAKGLFERSPAFREVYENALTRA